jgi:hypothetical protein
VLGNAVRTTITLAIVLLIVYLGLSGLYGYQVGRVISRAKASNTYIAIASNMIGREETEEYAINRLGVPRFITESPAFWLALHLGE